MALASPAYGDWLGTGTVEALGSALGDPPDIERLRSAAFASFLELPLEPNPLYRKYGYFAGVDLTGIDPVAPGAAVEPPPTALSAVRIVHDAAGTRAAIPPELTSAGVRFEPLADIWAGDEADRRAFLRGIDAPPDRLSALAVALLNRGYHLEVPEGVPGPVRVQDLTVLSRPADALSIRRTIRIGRGVRAIVSEEVYSTGRPDRQRLVGSSTALDAGPASQLAYLTVHAPDLAAIGLFDRAATLGDSSRLGWVWAGFGGFRTKMRNGSVLAGTGCDLEDLQGTFGRDRQAFDSSVLVTHRGTQTHGSSISRGVFQDEARGLNRGLVRIEKDARKTVSYLAEHAMLLSKGARSDSMPDLEILCRDVKATHSTSSAPVDTEKVFYLESRGVPRERAVRMISEGFLSHVFDRAPIARLSELLYPLLAARWAGEELPWRPDAPWNLPALEFAADVPSTDWRFDAKLR
ncbi:MAG TPA: SufD family Fe-S cluster assembly protein [Thermoplasmata archaeon]|nr:SufD family Fe-S cluster assembly protein [Thermoplasmata archaeon]